MPTPKKYCKQPKATPRVFEPGFNPNRASFILSSDKKWVNGTNLTFCFLKGKEPQRKVVRQAFKHWKSQGIGLTFQEVPNPKEAIVRISFVQGDGSWSYVGRDALSISKSKPTMNFGWDLTDSYGMTTALHEIGHALGFQHEHQSPFAGIVWNVQAVYDYFGGPPNNWDRSTIDHNIIQKMPANQVKGSKWDPKSIMEYEFDAGLVASPAPYQNGIFPPGILSVNDIKGVKLFYPALAPSASKKMTPGKSLAITGGHGSQSNFEFVAPQTGKFTFKTEGKMDTVLVLWEKAKGGNHYLSGDDDSGTEKNASITMALVKGRTYVANLRVMYAGEEGGKFKVEEFTV